MSNFSHFNIKEKMKLINLIFMQKSLDINKMQLCGGHAYHSVTQEAEAEGLLDWASLGNSKFKLTLTTFKK